MSRLACYVLVGFNSNVVDDLYRINKLRELKIDPFVMPYRKNPYLNALAKWVNKKPIFGKFKLFEDYAQSRSNYNEILYNMHAIVK
jgi:hypothetical protein